MKKTILITGCSTGIGRVTAVYFQKKGWNVIATMRNPTKETQLTQLASVICPSLDVTSQESIQKALDEGIKKFGPIDVVVNNAGYGLTGPFEGMTEEQIRKQFETNVFGLMNVTRSILPHFRSKKSGILINISSVGGRIVFPYYSIYHATKFAVEGFTESLRFELEPLGIRAKLVEPGAIKTDFYDRSRDSSLNRAPSEYLERAVLGSQNMDQEGENGAPPEDVAATIFRAATDESSRIRYPVGEKAKLILLFRKFTSDSAYAALTRKIVFRRSTN